MLVVTDNYHKFKCALDFNTMSLVVGRLLIKEIGDGICTKQNYPNEMIIHSALTEV